MTSLFWLKNLVYGITAEMNCEYPIFPLSNKSELSNIFEELSRSTFRCFYRISEKLSLVIAPRFLESKRSK